MRIVCFLRQASKTALKICGSMLALIPDAQSSDSIMAESKNSEEFVANVDERLARAQEEQKLKDAQRERVAAGIAREISRQRREREEYEQMVIDLAYHEELQKLKAQLEEKQQTAAGETPKEEDPQ